MSDIMFADQECLCWDHDTWFDRTICPEPCGAMHTRCVNCGWSWDCCPHQDGE